MTRLFFFPAQEKIPAGRQKFLSKFQQLHTRFLNKSVTIVLDQSHIVEWVTAVPTVDVCTSILPRSRLLVLTVVAEILNITVRFYRFTVVSQRFVRISFPENDYLLISVKIRNNRQTNSAATVFSQYK